MNIFYLLLIIAAAMVAIPVTTYFSVKMGTFAFLAAKQRFKEYLESRASNNQQKHHA